MDLATTEGDGCSVGSAQPGDIHELDLVAEKQGSARLFAAFKKNFNNI